MSDDKLSGALAKIAARPEWRDAFVRQVLEFEKEIATPGFDIREEVTGPLVDAVYREGEVVRRTLSTGVVLDFLYRSKIARDFVMSQPAIPDHAWEPQTSKIVVDLARGAKEVVIGGAYFGDHAILIAREVAPGGGRVHAFEPNSDQRAMLVRNAELNGLTNVAPRPEGLWDTSSESLRLVGYDSFASAERVEADSPDSFRTLTIADYLAGAGVDRLDLIVVDIEGAELAALTGAERFLSLPAGQAPNIVFEVHRDYVDWSQGLPQTAIARFLTDRGYKLFALRDFNSNYDLAGQPIELIPADRVHLDGPPHGFNMVAVKDESLFANDRYRIVEDVSPKLLRHKDPKLHHPVGGLPQR
jgi:FkbM family methyltransferase